MNSPTITTKPFGAHALLIEWPNEVHEHILESIIRFEAFLKKEGVLSEKHEMIPAYNSLLIINRNKVMDHELLSHKIHQWYSNTEVTEKTDRFLWRLPVSYDLEFGLDLQELSENLQISIPEIIELHTKPTYTVFGIGFLPGFMYLGGIDERLQVARKSVPRPKVVKGAVGIAGEQAGIYPQESPGGWNIIGNCSVPIFDATKEDPCFVKVGDKIQFYEISRAEYDLHKIETQVGIYKVEKIKLDA